MVPDMDSPPLFGTLYVVATPLGHLADMTFRAVEVLKQVDLIAAEDTRHSQTLLNHYGITARLVSCHEHNETDRIPRLIDHLKAGRSLALISDAGTPAISDPGYPLVRAAIRERLPVVPVPGCSAVIAGLSVSGLPTDAFYFSGFLPARQQKRRQAIEKLKDLGATLVVYESPKRIIALIQDMMDILGDRGACLAREITKVHEEFLRGSLSDVLSGLKQKDWIKGECTLMVAGRSLEAHPPLDDQALEELIRNEPAATDRGTSDLARHLADKYNLPRKRLYDKIIELRKNAP